MKNTLKLIENKIPQYNDSSYHEDGYQKGYVILEASVDGSEARFKVPAYEDSSGSQVFEWTKTTAVEKVKKTIEVWE